MSSDSKVPLHSYDKEALRLTIPCFVLGSLSVALRFLSKYFNRSGIWLDDYLLLATFTFFVGVCAILIENIMLGVYGIPTKDIPPDVLVAFLKGAYADQALSAMSLGTAKYTLLAFYWRLFPTPWVRKTIIVMAIICTGYFIGVVCGLLFRCVDPISAAWNPFGPPGKCFGFTRFFLAEEPVDLFTNLMIVYLPIPIVWRLQMKAVRKLQLSFVFAFGSCACLISAIRIGLTATDPSLLLKPIGANLLFIQVTLEVIAVNLPTYGPLVKFCFGDKATGTISRRTKTRTNATYRLDSVVDITKEPRSESQDRIYSVEASAQSDHDPFPNKDFPIPLNSIRVKRTVEMV